MARIKLFTSTGDTVVTTGTGSLVGVGVAPTGYLIPASAIPAAVANNDETTIRIQTSDGLTWEVCRTVITLSVGIYTYSRGTLIASSTGSRINFGVGTKEIYYVIDSTLLGEEVLTTAGDVLYHDGTKIVRLGIGSTDNVLKVTGGIPAWAAPSSYFTWNTSASTSISATVNNAYVLTHTALQTVTLPTTAAVGDRIKLVGVGTGKWKVAQNASELIRFGNGLVTTTGTGGFIQSLDQNASVELVCVVANTEWEIIQSDGNITSNGSYIASQMPSIDLIVAPELDNSVRWTTATAASGATVAFGTDGLTIITSATSGGNGRASYHSTSTYNYFTGNVDYSCIAQVQLEGSNYQSFWGMGRPTTAAAGLTMTDKHIGFEIQRSAGTTTLYATCGDGTTQTKTAITTLSAGTDQVYQFVKDGTTAVRFYLDGVYKTTITTNIPTAAPVSLFGICATNRSTASSSIISLSHLHYRRRGNQ